MKRSATGLTLIEVLVALAIISIALTAIIKATSQSVRSTAYLKQKTIALWVGQESLNEARIQLVKLPNAPDKLTTVTSVFGDVWYWQGSKEKTANAKIKKIQINVFNNDPESADAPIISLEAYQ